MRSTPLDGRTVRQLLEDRNPKRSVKLRVLGVMVVAILGSFALVVVSGILRQVPRSPVKLLPTMSMPSPRPVSACGGAKSLSNGLIEAPIQIERADSEVVMFASICIGDNGLYPFIIDTGAQHSIFRRGTSHTPSLDLEFVTPTASAFPLTWCAACRRGAEGWPRRRAR